MLTHAHAPLTGARGTTDYIDGDLNRPAEIVQIAREKLDFSRPVAIMLMGILGHIGDPEKDDDQYARSIVQVLKNALPAGSYLALYEGTNTEAANNETGAVPYICGLRITSSVSLTVLIRLNRGLCRSKVGGPTSSQMRFRTSMRGAASR